MRTLLSRTGAGVALVLAVGLVAPAGPTAASTTPDSTGKARTSLSIRVAVPAVAPGGTDRVSGDLQIGQGLSPAGRPVVLEARPDGSDEFVPIAQVATGPQGGVRYDVAPPVTTRYRWRYDGGDDARASLSGVATVAVKDQPRNPNRIVTSLSVRHVVRLDDGAGDHRVLGTVDIVRGMLRAGDKVLRNRPVLLLKRPVGTTGWQFARSQRTNDNGAVRFRVDPGKDMAFKLYFLGARDFAPSRSGIVKVPVRPDVTISAGQSEVPQGASTTVSGVVSFQDAVLPGALVKLWAVQVGVPDSGTVVGEGSTQPDGTIQFTVTPTTTTRYRLRVLPTDTRAGTASAPVVVGVTEPPASTQDSAGTH